MDDGSGWMARLAPLEPLIPDGLAPFTAAQQALAEFLEVDVDLLAGAGMDRPVAQNTAGSTEIAPWLAALSLKLGTDTFEVVAWSTFSHKIQQPPVSG